MQAWETIYQEKLRTPEQVARMIPDNAWFFCGSREATSTLKAIWSRTDLRNPHYYCGQINDAGFIFDSPAGKEAYVMTGFLGSKTLPYFYEGKIHYSPGHFSGASKRVEEYLRAGIALACVSRPDKDGYVSFGNSADYMAYTIHNAKLKVAEINDQLPFVYGTNLIHISEFDYIVEGESVPLNETIIDADPENEKYRAIGGYLSELLEDGATIEIGIGRLNSAAMLHLDGVKDLGIHTEIFGDAMMDLVERGIVTNERKSINRGISVCCQIVGSKKLYEWTAHNHSINMMPTTYSLNPGIIARNYKMTAINNAINVDLFGQVNAESLKNRQYTGMGGIGDFSRGASLCPNGKSIIVVESTTKNDQISKIVPFFTPGTPVSVPRTDVEYVVTEYGIAKLCGASIQEKAHALIQIAHPKFRDELTEEARKMNIF